MNDAPPASRRFGCLHVLLFVLLAVALTAAASYFVFKAILFPKAFRPVRLDAREEQALQRKLDRLDFGEPAAVAPETASGALEPEPYDENGADRTLRFTERELNALLAKNTDLADKLAIDLSPDLISLKLILPLEEDVPVLGGKTLRVRAGATFRYADGRPVVLLKGVSVMGIPLPNAWMGGLKNVDVVGEFGGDEGFWKTFADGVESLRVEDGVVAIALKE